MAVVTLATAAGEPPCLVIKMPMTRGAATGLERETSALETLHADDALGRWRELLPRPCASGNVDGQTYRVDSALTGRPRGDRSTDDHARRKLLCLAADAILVLHRATATTLRDSSEIGMRWVDVHLHELTRRSIALAPLDPRIRRLRDELHDALAVGMFSASWIHGDYWLGNALFSSARSTPETLSGIVDWDASAPRELPLHDALHLVLFAQRLRGRRELGQLVRDHLSGRGWSADERIVLDRHEPWLQRASLSERHALLLYWLRQMAMHARQQPLHVGYRYRLWERLNVLPVLGSL